MALGKRLFTTGAAACLTETTDIFGGSTGKALYSMDYDASDTSGVYDGTPTNVDFGVGGQINTGARFNGSSSRITLPKLSTITADVTVSGWLNLGNTSTSNRIRFIEINLDGNGYAGTLSVLYKPSNGEWVARAGNGTSSNSDVLTHTYTLTQSTWYHVCFTRNDSTNETKFYINGSLQDTETVSVSSSYPSDATGVIGDLNYSASQNYNWLGTIDQVRVFSTALLGGQVSTLAAEQACVHTSTTDIVDFPSGTTNAAYYKLDNSAEDSKGTNDGTETSSVQYRFGRYGQAAVFNGSNSIITATQPSGINGPCSYSIWLKTTSSSYQSIITVGSISGSHTAGVNLFVNSGKLSCQTGNGSNTENTTVNSTSNVDTGNWVHCVVTVAGSTQGSAIKIYINGVNETSGTADNTAIVTATGEKLCLGGRILSGSQSTFLNGSLDQARIFTSALSAANVTSLYNEKPETDTSNFKTVLWEGTSANQFVSNVGMDLETNGGVVWLKNRDVAYDHMLLDSVRGLFHLYPNLTNTPDAAGGIYFRSFENNGFFVGSSPYVNASNNSYVAWVWKGGGAAVSNGNGSITSSVSANSAAGFSIVNWTGSTSTSAETVGHGLSSAPELVILKNRDAVDAWYVFANGVTSTSQALKLNTDDAVASTSTMWGAGMTSTVAGIRPGSFASSSSHNVIMYCFHSVAGYQKISSYSAGSVGLRIYTTDDGTSSGSNGFRPSFVMIKNTTLDSTNWVIVDSRRPDKWLYANESDADASVAGGVVLQDDGFSLGNQGSYINASGSTYLYMAIK